MKYDHVFTPAKIGSLEIPNRIVMPAMGTNFAEADGSAGARLINYYAARAKAGVGLIVLETCAITPVGGRAVSASVTLHDGKYIPGLTELTDVVHAYGAKIAVQLNHTGRQAFLEDNSRSIPVAPSPIPCPLVGSMDVGVVPKELTEKEIEEIIENFALASMRAKKAGFDSVEIHCAHGYLIHQFLSPLTNKRSDTYGGSFEKRMTFALKVIQEVRRMVGEEYPIIIRINGEDAIDDGLTIEDTKKIAAVLGDADVDAISVSSGTYPTLHRCLSPIYYSDGFHIPFCAEIKRVVNIPVIGVGRVHSLALAEEILARKDVDLVAIGRGLIADPEVVSKSRDGREEDVRPCIYCNFCCSDRLLLEMQLRCAVNAEAGREVGYALKKTESPKSVLVIGGGPGGMEAARVAALRGHNVMLVEKDDRLGGQLLPASAPTFKMPLRRLVDYLVIQVRKAGVEVKLGKEVKEDDITKWAPDVVIIAAGASPYISDIPGADRGMLVEDVLRGSVEVEKRVVICGGGSVGCETSLFLAENGKEVTLVEMLDELTTDLNYYSRNVLLEKIRESKVKILTSRKMVEVTADGAIVEDKFGKKESLEADSVVFALGSRSNRSLIEGLKDKMGEVYTIGDCVRPGRVHNATLEAAHVAREI